MYEPSKIKLESKVDALVGVPKNPEDIGGTILWWIQEEGQIVTATEKSADELDLFRGHSTS